MRVEILAYALVTALAFTTGYLSTNTVRGELHLSSEASINSYDVLPCPSETKINEWKSRITLDFGKSQASCDDPYGGKFLKLLQLADSLKVNLPENWGGAHRKSLEKPLDYILSMTPYFSIDITQQNAIASNFIGQRIFLGSLFFDLSPLDALQVLIHESRHSSISDPKHVDCRTGDIPKSARACDETFSISADAGAYSFGFVFQLGLSLFGEGLSESDRAFLRDSALTGISKRFNRIPEFLALPLDLLFVLKDERVYVVQPFTLELIEIPRLSGFENERITRIQYEPINQGVLVFHESGRVYAIDQGKKPRPYYNDLLPQGIRLVDSSKVYSSAGKYAYTYFLTDENKVYFKEVDKDSGRNLFSPLDFQPPVHMKRFFSADVYGSFFLSQDGRLFRYQTATRGLKSEPYAEERNFSLPNQKWEDVSGGATYDLLIGVASDGLIYTNFNGLSSAENKPERLVYKSNAPVKKFQEGLNIKVALGSKGQVFVQDYTEASPKPWILPFENVQDFAIGRMVTGAELFKSDRKLTQKELNWAATCQVERPLYNPWTDSAFGLNKRGYLVFSESTKPCKEAIHIARAQSQSMRLVGSELYKTFNYFSQVYLELKSPNGEPIKWKPYSPLYPQTQIPY